MPKIKIEESTNEQLDYAVAVELGKECSIGTDGCIVKYTTKFSTGWEKYSPTANTPTGQAQCSDLIDKFFITQEYEKPEQEWFCRIRGHGYAGVFDKSRQKAVCKAFLWAQHPDGYIEVQE